MKLLYVQGSPRGGHSQSGKIAAAYLAEYRAHHPGIEIDVIDLWKEPLPEFDGDRAAAKMSFFGGPDMDGAQRSAWDEIVSITNRFTSADQYLFTVPMWNAGIPYRLKLYIDIMTQPGLLFGFDPQEGYSGLLKNKKATVVYTGGVYGPGAPKRFGSDFHSTFFDDWLRFIGIEDIKTIRFQPNIVTADAEAGLAAAKKAAVLEASA